MHLELQKVSMKDKEEVERLCSGIWEGHDYIPKVFEDWVEDGGFYKGVSDGKIIALDKYTKLENQVIWLEGLRVHPEHQGCGYGREMVKRFLDLIKAEEECSYLRFMTSAGNEKTIRLAEEFGFELYLELYSLKLSREDVSSVDLVSKAGLERDIGDVLDIVMDSQEFKDNKGLYIPNWTADEISKDLLRREVSSDKCYSVREDDLQGVVFFDHYEPYDLISIPFITGDAYRLGQLFLRGVERMLLEKKDLITIKTGSKKIRDASLACGFEFTKHEHAVVFQK